MIAIGNGKNTLPIWTFVNFLQQHAVGIEPARQDASQKISVPQKDRHRTAGPWPGKIQPDLRDHHSFFPQFLFQHRQPSRKVGTRGMNRHPGDTGKAEDLRPNVGRSFGEYSILGETEIPRIPQILIEKFKLFLIHLR